jgi:hypothetical protein
MTLRDEGRYLRCLNYLIPSSIGEMIMEAQMTKDYFALVIATLFATVLACLINLYAPIPDVVRNLTWVVVGLGPILFLAVAMTADGSSEDRE